MKGTRVTEGPTVDEWPGLYNDAWKGLMTEAAFCHP